MSIPRPALELLMAAAREGVEYLWEQLVRGKGAPRTLRLADFLAREEMLRLRQLAAVERARRRARGEGST